jgi:amino-acid N-acetyltransferase
MHSITPADPTNLSPALELLKGNKLPTEDIGEATLLFVATENDSVIGTIGIEFYGDAGLLRSLAVAETKRNTGLGKKLVLFLEDFARQKGLKELLLLTTTAADFFTKNGYTPVEREETGEAIKRSSELTTMCPTSAQVMKKELHAVTGV